jgi:hypothetical protein
MRFHLVAFEKFGRKIKSGNEWKYSFQRLMIPFMPEIFPSHLLPLLARHFKTNGQQ